MFHGAFGAVCSRACPLAWSAGPTVPRYSTLRGGVTAPIRDGEVVSLSPFARSEGPPVLRYSTDGDAPAGRVSHRSLADATH